MFEHIPRAFIWCMLPTANCWTREVSLSNFCSRDAILTSLTFLGCGGGSCLIENSWKLASVLEIKSLAVSGVLSTRLPHLQHLSNFSPWAKVLHRNIGWEVVHLSDGGHDAQSFLNLFQYSYKVSPLYCLIPHISFLMLAALDAGKYLFKNAFFIPF